MGIATLLPESNNFCLISIIEVMTLHVVRQVGILLSVSDRTYNKVVKAMLLVFFMLHNILCNVLKGKLRCV